MTDVDLTSIVAGPAALGFGSPVRECSDAGPAVPGSNIPVLFVQHNSFSCNTNLTRKAKLTG